METKALAKPMEREYRGGRRFWTVQCNACMAVLNSGHHYYDRSQAVECAIHHNIEVHNAY